MVLPVSADSFRSMRADVLSMSLGLILGDDTEQREAVMIVTNELTRTYFRKLAPALARLMTGRENK